jgi:hypothetical protein
MGISCGSYHKVVKELKVFPFSIHVMHQLLHPACEKQNHYSEWLLEEVDGDPHMSGWTSLG